MSRILRQLFSSLSIDGASAVKPNIGAGPLLTAPSIELGTEPGKRTSIPLIPRVNPFLKPVETEVRNFQSFKSESTISVSPHILNAPIRKDIMHRVVVWHRAGLRQGTASSKARGEVAGSSRKIRQQKGSGKARAGSIRAPQRRGGGRCFGPKPRDHYFSLPPKIRALGLRSALTHKFKEAQLAVVNETSLQVPTHKTSQLVAMMHKIPVGKTKILLVDTENLPRTLKLASQSLPDQFKFINAAEEKINVYHVLDCSFLLITPRALQFLQPWLEQAA